jgi:hypothetical protein
MQIASNGTHEPPRQSFAGHVRKGAITFATNASNRKPLQLSARISKHMVDMVSWKSNVFSIFLLMGFAKALCLR